MGYKTHSEHINAHPPTKTPWGDRNECKIRNKKIKSSSSGVYIYETEVPTEREGESKRIILGGDVSSTFNGKGGERLGDGGSRG